MEKQNFATIVQMMKTYFDGLYQADSKALANVFHPDARYVNALQGDYMNRSMPEYFTVVDGRVPPAHTGDERDDQILSIKFGVNRMAFVEAQMTMSGRVYFDYLTLIFDDGEWRIIAKVFSSAPIMETV